MDRRPGHRVLDVFGRHLDLVAGSNTRDIREVRFVAHVRGPVQRRERLAEDRPWSARVPDDHRAERPALRVARAIVQERRRDAVPLVDGGGPVRVQAEMESRDVQLAVLSGLDPPGPSALAVAEGRPAVHVAWAADLAAARDHDAALDVPGWRLLGGPELGSLPSRRSPRQGG